MSGWIAETLVATTLLMAAVLILRAPVRRLFGAGAAYALWSIPAVRLIMPSFDLRPDIVASVVPTNIIFAGAEAAATDASNGLAWLVWPWAAGALLFAAWHVVGYRRFLSRAMAGTVSTDGRLLVSGAVDGPAAIGLLVGRILVPLDFDARFDPDERELALRHERIHLSRGDLWANAAALGVLSFHWFNPLAHLAYRAFRRDQELSCDAAVIAAASSEQRAAYGAAMVKAAHATWGTRAVPTTTCPMTRPDTLKWRLSMINTHKKSVAARAGGYVSTALLALAGLTLTATGGIAQEAAPEIKKIVVKRVAGKDLADAEVSTHCPTGSPTIESEVAGEQNGKPTKTKFILCKTDGGTFADQTATLEKLREGMAKTDELPADKRAQVLAAIDQAIAQTKAK